MNPVAIVNDLEIRQTGSLFIKRTVPSPNEQIIKKTPDNVKPWNFSISIYKSKLPGGNDLILFSLDEKVGKIYTCTLSPSSKEFDAVVFEADEEIKLIFDKIKLYNFQQTISGKGTEYFWNQLDYSLRSIALTSTLSNAKHHFIEVVSQVTFPGSLNESDVNNVNKVKQILRQVFLDICSPDQSTVLTQNCEFYSNEIVRMKAYIMQFFWRFFRPQQQPQQQQQQLT